MSGKMQWSRDAGSTLHPDDSILLAYTRQQSLDEGCSSIDQHIHGCEQCLRRCNEYEQISAGITGTLEHFQRTQYYPPLADDVFEFISNPAAAQLARRKRQAARRQRNKVSGIKWQTAGLMRLVPIGMAILMTFFISIGFVLNGLAFHLNGFTFHPTNSNQGRTSQINLPGQKNGTSPTSSVLTPLPTNATGVTGKAPTPTTGTATVTPTATATPVAQRPLLTICGSSQSRLVVCGSHLTPGDTVNVTVNIPGPASVPQRAATVATDGTIKVAWSINTCGIDRIVVHLRDEKIPLNIAQVLQLKTPAAKYCPVATPMPWAAPASVYN